MVVAAGTPGTSCIRIRQHNAPMVLRISEKKLPFLELGIFTEASDVIPSPLQTSTVKSLHNLKYERYMFLDITELELVASACKKMIFCPSAKFLSCV